MTLLRRIALVAVIVAVLIGLLVWSLPATLPLGLKMAGVDDVTWGSIDVGLRGARIEALAIGQPPGQRIEVVEADYSLQGLLAGRIKSVRIDGVRAKAAYRNGVLSLSDGIASSADESGGGEGGSTGMVLPFQVERLQIADSRLDVETPLGDVSLSFAGDLAVIDDRLTATGRLGLESGGITSPGGAPLTLTGAIDLGFDERRLTLSGPLGLTAPDGAVDGRLSAVIAFDEQGQPATIEQGEAAFDMRAIHDGQVDLDRGRVELELNGALDHLEGDVTLDLDGLTTSFGAVAVRGIRGQRVFHVTRQGDRIEVSAREPGDKISVDGVTLLDAGDALLESGWFTLQWPGRDSPLLRYDLDARRFDLDWPLEIDPVRLDVGETRFWARIEDLGVMLAGSEGGLSDGRVRIRQGRTDLPSANLALTGIESDIRLGKEGLAPDQPIPLTIRAVRPLAEPRIFSPLRLEARVTPTPERLAFEGQVLVAAQPSAALDLTGGHDLVTAQGSIDLNLAPLTFGASALQPRDLSPLLDGVIDQAVGKIALDGAIAWGDGRLDGELALLIEELGFTIGPARLARINSVIRFDHISPLSTEHDQLLSVGLLDVGLPLTDGLVSMQLRPSGLIAVDQLTWRLADGMIHAAPFTFGSDVEDLTMMLQAEQLDLEALLRLTPLDDLTGEGRIDGTLPLQIGAAAAAIQGGELAASDPGIIRYAPSSAPDVLQAGGESVSLMLQALENFHYEALKLTLDGKTDGDTAIGLHLKGANPDLYDGHPVEFNLNLDGNLASLIQTNLDNYQIPDRIRERLQKFER